MVSGHQDRKLVMLEGRTCAADPTNDRTWRLVNISRGVMLMGYVLADDLQAKGGRYVVPGKYCTCFRHQATMGE